VNILDNVTFTIPFKNDSVDRVTNLELVIKYLTNYFNTNIYIGEEGKETVKNLFGKSVLYFNYEDDNKGFKKCSILNDLAKRCTTDVICSCDADCFLLPDQYIKSVNSIINDETDLVIPFDGTCYNIDRCYVESFKNYDLSKINLSKCRLRRKNTVGGVNFYNRRKFLEWGMWNENFRAWGAEDDEFIHRISKLNYRIMNIKGCLYHLNHVRTEFGRPKNIYYSDNMNEFNKIRNMYKTDLLDYIKDWNWIK